MKGKMELALLEKLQKALQYEGLTPFSSCVAIEYLKKQLNTENSQVVLARVIGYAVSLLNNSNSCGYAHPLQLGCPNIIPCLRGSHFWWRNLEFYEKSIGDVETPKQSFLTVIQILEENFNAIKEEFLNLRNCHNTTASSGTGFQHYRSPIQQTPRPIDDKNDLQPQESRIAPSTIATDKGDWNVFYFFLHGLNFEDNLRKCPRTAEILSSIPRHYSHAFFSALAPDTHIKPHNGPTNKKLRCHLPLVVPRDATNSENISAAYLIVGGEKVYLEEGKCVVFDDSFVHEAGNTSLSEPRVVLVVDFWHPDFTDPEIKFMSFINNAQIKAAQRLHKARLEAQTLYSKSTASHGEDTKSVKNEPETRVTQEHSFSSSEIFDDFFSVIRQSQNEGISDTDVSLIWGAHIG